MPWYVSLYSHLCLGPSGLTCARGVAVPQIIPPVDAGITDSILANLAPWQAYDYSADAVFGHERCLEQRDELGAAYISAIAAKLCRYRDANAVRPWVMISRCDGAATVHT